MYQWEGLQAEMAPWTQTVMFFSITILLLHLFHTILPNSLALRTRGYTRNHYRDSLQSLSMTHTLIADSLTYNYT